MDGHRFDDLARILGVPGTRRGLLKGLLGTVAGAGFLGVRGDAATAQVSQAQCGNVICARDPGKCTPGCVCCVYSNGNSRCRPPGTCSPGTITCPAGQSYCPALGRCAACCTVASCPASADPCQVAVCQNGTCGIVPGNDGAACDDGNACTQTATCQGGTCAGGDPVVCQPLDQCHVAGSCDPTTGACSNPNAPNGTGCNDGNACSTGDTCQAGACTGGTALTCTTDNPCLTASCDPIQGCTTTPKGRGEACGNGNRCDGDEVCDGVGACVPGTPVVCGPCLACDAQSGSCVAANEGGGCPGDGNECFGAFACRAGACVGEQPVVCQASDQCHAAGTCDPATGLCSNPDLPDGTDCEDGDLCTGGDSCEAGVCRPGIFSTLCLATPCASQTTCNPATGRCEATSPAPNGTVCTRPGESCSTSTCQDGACVVTSTVDCSYLDNECGVGVCDGVGCTTQARPENDGELCGGDNGCNVFRCAAGSCVDFGPANACVDPTGCNIGIGSCDPATGTCSYENVPNAPDGQECARPDRFAGMCDGGVCTCAEPCEGFGVCCFSGQVCCPAGFMDSTGNTRGCVSAASVGTRCGDGRCYEDERNCCDFELGGRLATCPAGESCCAVDIGFGGDGCCNPLEQCGAFGCSFFVGG